ncbi:MAG: thiamine-phosphate kinase [Candidatus Solibacter sp.]|jgi:thiamine-monophosphate kinase
MGEQRRGVSGITLRDIGEKRLIAEYIRPLFNPSGLNEGVGNDCALLTMNDDVCVCASTDRVPADLVSFKLGLINFRQLGQYLAVLNISDIAAAGGEPRALLLNLAFPPDFAVSDLNDFLLGAKEAGDHYGAPVLGGDLSDAVEMNLVATSLGVIRQQQAIFRSGARPGNKVFCSDYLGVTPTAFLHYLYRGAITHAELSLDQEAVLTSNFRRPIARVGLGRQLAMGGYCTAMMDVTDGVAQSFAEIAASSSVGIVLDTERLPIHPVSRALAAHYDRDVVRVILGPGADFQLVGTLDLTHAACAQLPEEVRLIGEVIEGSGVYLRSRDGEVNAFAPEGWNYYAESQQQTSEAGASVGAVPTTS